jgi:hypothetical protein
MPVYPPLTPANLAELNRAIAEVEDLHVRVREETVFSVFEPHHVDELELHIGQVRGLVQALDLKLFRLFGLIHRLRNSNLPPASATPVQRRPPPTLDTLEDMFS